MYHDGTFWQWAYWCSVLKEILHLKQRRFSMDQNFQFAFPEISSGEWNAIFKNCRRRRQPRELAISKFLQLSYRNFLYVPFDFHPLISRTFCSMVAFRKFYNFRPFQILFKWIFEPFDPHSRILGWMECAQDLIFQKREISLLATPTCIPS